MKLVKRAIAATELLFIIPATLFMIALFMREVQPLMHTGLLVNWFSTHTVLGLYISLIAMPFAALVVGGVTIFSTWQNDAEFRQTILKMIAIIQTHWTVFLISLTTFISAGILVIVSLHMITE